MITIRVSQRLTRNTVSESPANGDLQQAILPVGGGHMIAVAVAVEPKTDRP